MNQQAEIWNVLHDGGISRIHGSVPGNLTLEIDIPYLRRMFSNNGEKIMLTLHDCTRFKMKIWEDDRETEVIKEIEDTNTEILSTDSEHCPVTVITTQGAIDVDFLHHTLKLDDGIQVDHEQLVDACERYWNKLESEAKQKQAEPADSGNG